MRAANGCKLFITSRRISKQGRSLVALGVLAGVCVAAALARDGPADSKDVPHNAVSQQPVAPPAAQVDIETRKKPNEGTTLESRPPDIKVTRELVLINVSVTDPLNRFVTGLEKENFRLYEDKVEQQIRSFSSEDAPISIGLVFDTSGSMGPKLQKSREAAADFFRTANPADEFFLIRFSDRPELVTPFTTDTDQIQSALTFTQSKGRGRCSTAYTSR